MVSTRKISKWQDHIIHTIKTYALKLPFSSATCKFRDHVYVNERVTKRRPSEKRDMILEISFDDLKEEPWLVKTSIPMCKVMVSVVDQLRV